MSSDNKNWNSEFNLFVQSDHEIPVELSSRVLGVMSKLMNPSPFRIFSKLLGFHFVFGLLSLSICHQFGLNPFNTRGSFSDWLMEVGGHNFCMIGCGILFIGLSIAAAGYFLSIEEARVLRKTRFLQISALSLFSLGIFVAVGAQLALTIGGLWLLGGLVGGLVTTEITWQLKRV